MEQKRSRELAELLDSKFTIPGTNIRFGLDPVISLVPGVGDWLSGLISIYFLFQAVLAGGGNAVLVRMLINILLDILLGTIPLLGDLFDVAWKANTKNVELLQEVVENPAHTQTKSRWFNWLLFILFTGIIVGLLALLSWLIIEIFESLF